MKKIILAIALFILCIAVMLCLLEYLSSASYLGPDDVYASVSKKNITNKEDITVTLCVKPVRAKYFFMYSLQPARTFSATVTYGDNIVVQAEEKALRLDPRDSIKTDVSQYMPKIINIKGKIYAKGNEGFDLALEGTGTFKDLPYNTEINLNFALLLPHPRYYADKLPRLPLNTSAYFTVIKK